VISSGGANRRLRVETSGDYATLQFPPLPRRDQPILGRISKRGCRYLRTLFIQAAHIIMMRPHNWSRFSFGSWLEQASERMHKNKLAAALANKLARITWSILRYGNRFDTNRIEVMAI
jgi:transposase